MKKGASFYPTEIIFSVTDYCNLQCAHCWSRGGKTVLDAEKAIRFLERCIESSSSATPSTYPAPSIDTIGFTGGEPFLAMDFVEQVANAAVKKNLFFDRIITNGVWWKNESELQNALSRLYKSGFDGKIALSFDSFHNQSIEKIAAFCKAADSVFKSDRIIEIQSVVKSGGNKDAVEINFLKKLHDLSNMLCCSFDALLNKKTGTGKISMRSEEFFITVDRTPRVLKSTNPEAWRARRWFSDDFCTSLGNILFVHPDGKIAPCCGFSNEENAIIIGTIEDPLEKIMENAHNNKMVKICFETGLLREVRKLRKKIALPGKTQNPCTLCQFLCGKMQGNL